MSDAEVVQLERGPLALRVFLSTMTQHAYATRSYRAHPTKAGLVEVTGKKDDVTKDVQNIVFEVAGDLWNWAHDVLEMVKEHDPEKAHSLEEAIAIYEKFMFDHETVVLH